ncbi:STAS domain-containing protein [Thalassoglobus sp. JC818]|uniref:STAS domain-containing protein n=1 Tax=Thalassoglobus sp. JC818 TaxID=3232136 RepID=UPI0034586481
MSIPVTHRDIDGVQVLVIGIDDVSISEDALEEISQKLLDYTVSIPPQVVVDMQHIDFFGSSFIETLFRMWNRIKAVDGGRFALSGLRPYCLEVLQVTNLTSVWPIYPDVDTAVASFNDSRAES